MHPICGHPVIIHGRPRPIHHRHCLGALPLCTLTDNACTSFVRSRGTKRLGSIRDPPDFDAYIPPEELSIASIYLSTLSQPRCIDSVKLKLRGFHSHHPHYYNLPSRYVLLPESDQHPLAQQLDFRRLSVHSIHLRVACCSLVFPEHA